MSRKREQSPGRRMRKLALVICEGETEAEYIALLKKWYKSPIKIISHIEGTRISSSLIDAHIRELKISVQDKIQVFLVYDMDNLVITEKLNRCKAELVLSNPCFELWILLHVQEQRAAITTNDVIKTLQRSHDVWKHYTKAVFTETQQAFLKQHINIAINRAKKLNDFKNPSTQVYKIIEQLKLYIQR